jgi:hypothetical protein
LLGYFNASNLVVGIRINTASPGLAMLTIVCNSETGAVCKDPDYIARFISFSVKSEKFMKDGYLIVP